jgi:hypothetical protein
MTDGTVVIVDAKEGRITEELEVPFTNNEEEEGNHEAIRFLRTCGPGAYNHDIFTAGTIGKYSIECFSKIFSRFKHYAFFWECRQVAPASLAVCGENTNAILVFSVRTRQIGSSLQPHIHVQLPDNEDDAISLYINTNNFPKFCNTIGFSFYMQVSGNETWCWMFL